MVLLSKGVKFPNGLINIFGSRWVMTYENKKAKKFYTISIFNDGTIRCWLPKTRTSLTWHGNKWIVMNVIGKLKRFKTLYIR